jgi:hypothetical protein
MGAAMLCGQAEMVVKISLEIRSYYFIIAEY